MHTPTGTTLLSRLSRGLLAFGLLAAIGSLSIAQDAPKSEAPKADADKPEEPKVEALPNVPDAPYEQSKFINIQLRKAWAENKITPSPRATNYEFTRRAFIDLIGRIPTSDEARKFSVMDRKKVIETLLYGTKKTAGHEYVEEYAKHWANIWTVWTLTRSANSVYHEQMQSWLEEQFTKNISHKELTEKLLTAKGKTNDNGAVNFIIAHLGEKVPAENSQEGKFEAVPITSRVTRLFLGLQTQCVQCHDHPFNPEFKQKHFWGVNVFFRQVDRDRDPTPANARRLGDRMMTGVAQPILSDNPNLNKSGIVGYERRTGLVQMTKGVFLDDKLRIPSDLGGKTRREWLAQFVIKHDNYAPAFVNRLWAHFFGRGLNETPAFDDFGEHNKVVHPELLERLAADFKNSSYDTKTLITWICNSEAYSLSSRANSTNKETEKEVFFSRMPMKSMSPEVLFESLLLANKVETKGDDKKRLREAWMKKLVQNFGDDEGNEVTFNGTVVQALLLMNGKEMNEALKDGGVVGAAYKRHGNSPAALLNELFMSALGRPVSPGELALIERLRTGGGVLAGEPSKPAPKPSTPAPQPPAKGKANPKKTVAPPPAGSGPQIIPPATDLLAFYQDVYWALLNSNEFILNH